jgi:hypothetical protein
MYEKHECANWAYQKLQEIEILERARKVEEDLTSIFLLRTIYDGKTGQIVEGSRKAKPNEEEQDILSLEAELEAELNVLQMNPHVIKHPFLVAKVVLGDDLEKFSQYAFSSKKDLASAVTAYCIGEMGVIKSDTRVNIWRQGIHKNVVQLLSTNGDMFTTQTDVSGIENSGVLIDPLTSGYSLDQEWSPFLITVLKYAQAIGKSDLPEIKEWQKLIEKLRVGQFWSGNKDFDFTKMRSNLAGQFKRELYGTGDKNLPLWINDDTHVLPYFNNGELDILQESEKGEIEMELYRKDQKFQRVAHYIPEDLPHLLKANYQLYARNVDDMAKIMYHFNKEFNK